MKVAEIAGGDVTKRKKRWWRRSAFVSHFSVHYVLYHSQLSGIRIAWELLMSCKYSKLDAVLNSIYRAILFYFPSFCRLQT